MTAPTMDAELDARFMEEIAPPCDITEGGDPCSNTAEWVGIKRCCANIRLLCQKHYDIYIRLTSEQKVRWLCTPCKAQYGPGEGLYASLERL